MDARFSDLTRRLRRTDLILLRAVRRQRSRPAVRAKGQFWGSVVTDDEVDALLRAHGEIDYPPGVDGLADALAASTAYRDAPGNRGTEVEALIAYVPPGGELGRWIAKLFRAEPALQGRRDLKRFKMLMETGEIATSANRKSDK